MFAYCGNNPVRQSDPSGNSWIEDIFNDIEEVKEVQDQIINGQEKHGLKNVTFGWSTLGQSGCGVLAAHNATILSGRESNVLDVATYFAKKSPFRFFGIMPWEIGEYLDDNNIPYKTYTKKDESKLWSDLQDGGVAIVSFWNKMVNVGYTLSPHVSRNTTPNVFRGAHTVAITYSEGEFCVYNAYSEMDTIYYLPDINKYIAGGFINGYVIPAG